MLSWTYRGKIIFGVLTLTLEIYSVIENGNAIMTCKTSMRATKKLDPELCSGTTKSKKRTNEAIVKTTVSKRALLLESSMTALEAS